jgi:hypothetical protein
MFGGELEVTADHLLRNGAVGGEVAAQRSSQEVVPVGGEGSAQTGLAPEVIRRSGVGHTGASGDLAQAFLPGRPQGEGLRCCDEDPRGRVAG